MCRGGAVIGPVVFILAACVQPPPTVVGPVGEVVAEGVIVCPPPTARCELSGATMAAGRLLLANDRPSKVNESVLVLSPSQLAPRVEVQRLPGLPALAVQKLEAMTTSPDGRHVFAMTSFDRRETAAQDPFNVLVSWPSERPQAARVLDLASGRAAASLELRRQLRLALASPAEAEGPAHYKVEGLAALPDRLLIGVREVGRSYKEFRYTLTVLSLPWRLEKGRPVLAGAPSVVWRVDPATLPPLPKMPVGLSEFVYDLARDRLWLLTSFERDDDKPDAVAGYLWTLDRAALERGAPPVLVHGKDGKPLMFSHKSEALAILPDGRLLMVHDDDGRATLVPDQASGIRRPRLMTEAMYQVLTVTDAP